MGGSLSPKPRSMTALEIAAEGAQAADASLGVINIEIINMAQLGLPFFVPEQNLNGYPAEQREVIAAFLEKIKAADGYIFSAPIYHGTLGGVWKNAIDFLELLPRKPQPYLDGKVIGLIAVGSGQIAAPNGITALQHIARALRAWTTPGSLPVWPAKRIFDAEGQLQDEKMAEQLRLVGQQVVEFVQMRRSYLSK